MKPMVSATVRFAITREACPGAERWAESHSVALHLLGTLQHIWPRMIVVRGESPIDRYRSALQRLAEIGTPCAIAFCRARGTRST